MLSNGEYGYTSMEKTMKRRALLAGGFLIITMFLFIAYYLVINADQFRPQVQVEEGEVFEMPSSPRCPLPAKAVPVDQNREPI